MKLKMFFLANFMLILSFSFLSIEAQTKRKPKPKNDVLMNPTIPEIKDFAFVVNIDKNANVTLSVQKTEDTEVLANASNTKTLTDFFTKFYKPQTSLEPIYIVRADASLKYSEVVKVIQAFRVSSKQQIKIELSKKFYAFIPPKLSANEMNSMRPNPLMLIIELNEDMTLKINGEEKGSLNDTLSLTNYIKQIFKAREENGIFRSGTNDVETTIFVKAPTSAKFADVIKLTEDLKEAGSTLIGLALDEYSIQQNIILNVVEMP